MPALRINRGTANIVVPGRLRAGTRRLPIWIGVAVFVTAAIVLALRSGDSGSVDRLSGSAALRSALVQPKVRQYLHRYPYTRTRTIALDSENMRVSFFNRSRIVLDAAVAPDGTVPHTIEYTPGYVRAGNEAIQTPLALVVLSLLFVLAVASVPLRRARNLDALALVSFGVSIVLLNERLFELSVWAGYPPLAYLGVRCLHVALAGPRFTSDRSERPLFDVVTGAWSRARRLRLLRIAALAAAIALVIASVPGGAVGDVGFASIAGATQLLHGHLPYGHLPTEIVHGDTYPLLAYALYIPVAVFMPVHDAFDNLDGALIVATAGALLAALGIYLASSRQCERDRSESLRHAIAWLVFPPVLITASSGSNDMVAAALLAGALAVLLRTARPGLLLTLAGWVKLVSFFLLPFVAGRFRSRGLVRFVAAVVGVTLAVACWVLLLGGSDGLGRMIDGISFQAERGSLLSLWTLLGIGPVQIALQAAVLSLVAVSPLLVSRDQDLARNPRRLAALAGSILIGFQLAANYWSYAYLPWALPCVMIALLVSAPTRVSVRAG
jgi:hypothetical protein